MMRMRRKVSLRSFFFSLKVSLTLNRPSNQPSSFQWDKQSISTRANAKKGAKRKYHSISLIITPTFASQMIIHKNSPWKAPKFLLWESKHKKIVLWACVRATQYFPPFLRLNSNFLIWGDEEEEETKMLALNVKNITNSRATLDPLSFLARYIFNLKRPEKHTASTQAHNR